MAGATMWVELLSGGIEHNNKEGTAMKLMTRFAVLGSAAAMALAAAGIGMGMGGRDAAPVAPALAGAADAKSYTGDPVHSNVLFKVKHAGASNFYGRFNKVNSTFS